LEVRSLAEDPALVDALDGADAEGFPHFLLQDPVWDACFASALEHSPELQLFLLEDGEVVAIANSVGIAWDGEPGQLPTGTHAAMIQSIDDVGAGRADTVCFVQGLTLGTSRGGGRAAAVGQALHELAERLGWKLVSPIRCVLKDRYPLIPLDEYVRWTREDGSIFDPWLRVQARHGGTVVRICEDSLVIEGTVDQWQEWTGLELPGPGQYVIAGGHVPLHIDEHRTLGRYAEPHVWVVYGGGA
jgi:hypothetical protein